MKNALATLPKLLALLDKAQTEEDVKAAWAKTLGIDYNTSDDHDLYTPQVLFEFKFDRQLTQADSRAPVVAQVMYYLRRLKFGESKKAIPPSFCVADKTACAIGEVADWIALYTDTAERFDWDLRPSSPDPALVAAVHKHPAFKKLHPRALHIAEEAQSAIDTLARLLADAPGARVGDKKRITEENFEGVFDYWNEVFGESVRNGYKSSRYFVADIQPGRTQLKADEGKVFFQVGPEELKIKKILAQDYERFWSLYEKCDDAQAIRGIIAKTDRLTDEVDRRTHGEFFTPLDFAKKGLDYLEKQLGRDWWKSGDYRLWDMAAGSGNLQYALPAAALKYCHLSTLYDEDVEHCERLFPGANIFQYDYLNDDIGNLFAGGAELNGQGGFDFDAEATWKMPPALRRDLDNPKLKWVILINPPFATAQQGGATGSNKEGVSMTKLRVKMHADCLGEVSRELFAQFLYRIRREFKGRNAWLGMFSKLKYVNATNDQKLRDDVFRYKFARGFMFSSVNFSGTSRSNQFPVGFLLWNLKTEVALEAQTIMLDVFDSDVQKTAIKNLSSAHRDAFLSKWIDRPPARTPFPPFSSAITVKEFGPDLRDRISEGFLASFMCGGNDLQHQNKTALLSGPYASAGSHSVTADNFEKSMIVHAVRRLPKADWQNDRDQFMQPQKTPTATFTNDCVVWSLLSNSNNTVAMKDVAYDGNTYQIENHLFPFPVKDLRKWKISDADIKLQLTQADDRFASSWLAARKLSPQSQAVLDAARAVYACYFQHLTELRMAKFKIETWDAGWWQVRSALADRGLGEAELAAMKPAMDKLKAKLLPQLQAYGFLS
jgi:hypothetical protein